MVIFIPLLYIFLSFINSFIYLLALCPGQSLGGLDLEPIPGTRDLRWRNWPWIVNPHTHTHTLLTLLGNLAWTVHLAYQHAFRCWEELRAHRERKKKNAWTWGEHRHTKSSGLNLEALELWGGNASWLTCFDLYLCLIILSCNRF